MPDGFIRNPELDHLLERARQERAEVTARMLRQGAATLWRWHVDAARALLRGLASANAQLALRRRRRAAMRELSALDDRLLKDIGLKRSEIGHLADRVARAGRPLSRAELRAEAAVDNADPAHKLKTPLTSIRSFSEILRDHPDLPPAERQAYLGVVLAESERLDRAIDEVLNGRRAA